MISGRNQKRKALFQSRCFRSFCGCLALTIALNVIVSDKIFPDLSVSLTYNNPSEITLRASGDKVGTVQSKKDYHQVKGAQDKKITFAVNATGSLATCVPEREGVEKQERSQNDGHPDEGFVTIACHKVYFRVPDQSFKNVGSIIFGVLSSAGGEGPSRRNSIRETWANDLRGVFFLVAGPWSDIAGEYEEHQDLIWIDEEEVYDGERSVLTYKTLSFASIVHQVTQKVHTSYSHCFKTDDDSYVYVKNLYKSIYNATEPHYDYWGWCQEHKFPPNRNDGKWSVTNETYPEPMFPRYCQGAGFALSQDFIDCAVNEKHLDQMRFMPFEDVAVGMLAERCQVTPVKPHDRKAIRLYRTKNKLEKENVKLHLGKMDREKIPSADVINTGIRVIQHRIYDEEDMHEHHKTVLDPDFVPEKRMKWRERVAEKEKEEKIPVEN